MNEENDARSVEDVELVTCVNAVLMGSWEETHPGSKVCVKHKRVIFGHAPLVRGFSSLDSFAAWPVDARPQPKAAVDRR